MMTPLEVVPFSPAYLEHYGVLPLKSDGAIVIVGHWRPLVDSAVLDDMRLAFGAEPELLEITEGEALVSIRRMHAKQAEDSEATVEAVAASSPESTFPTADLLTLANEAPVVRLVNLMLMDAVDARASDVHLEQSERGVTVRFRVDGMLQEISAPPERFGSAVISRIKVMAGLDVAERRLPQDGRFRLRVHNRSMDIRVSTVPILHGESVVMRLLDRSKGNIHLGQLGFGESDEAQFRAVINRPQGIVLNTGPTGSGKTTTLYAALVEISSGREKIITLEDPVEYELAGIAQVPVSPRVPFANALRALLRQDPDVLLIGEVRDRETAEIAIHAALTGHMVFSTLHTNDAVGAITRLVNIGIPPFLLAATLQAIVAQRLVRLVCNDCAQVRSIELRDASQLDGGPGDRIAERVGQGCHVCRGSGYHGRTALYELLLVDGKLREAIECGAAPSRLQELAVESGMRPLRQLGISAVRSGLTTVAEVSRVLGTHFQINH
jgi:general secretion pathway protein E